MLEILNIFSYVFGNPQIKKIKGHDSSLSQSKKTRKCYIHIIVGLIYKEQTLNEVFWFNILWAAHLGPPGMGRTKLEDAVRSSLLYCLYPDTILCLLHFSGLELTCSEQKRPGREAHHDTKRPSAVPRATGNRQTCTENKLLQQLSASRGAPYW